MATASATILKVAFIISQKYGSALLLALPLIAFSYAIAVAAFLVFWRESSVISYAGNIVSNGSFLVAVVAYVIMMMDGRSNNRTDAASGNLVVPDDDALRMISTFGVCLAVIGYLSIALIRNTHETQVVGGQDPAEGIVAGLPAGNNNTNTNNNAVNGKLVIVTGSSSGIGKETVRQLVKAGASCVIMACRNLEKAEQARQEIYKALAADCCDVNQSLELLELDLSSVLSVRRAADHLGQRLNGKKIDMLINNAGIMMGHQVWTSDGMELCMQANHLGHYLWTRLLLPHMNLESGARIISITSCTYKICESSGGICLDDLFCQYRRRYNLFEQYAQTKLANILFIKELARRYPASSSKLQCHAIHPGMVRTDVVRNMPRLFRYANAWFAVAVATLQKRPHQGAWCTMRVALLPTEELPRSGSYWVNQQVQETWPCANSIVAAKALWELSAKLVGIDPNEDNVR